MYDRFRFSFIVIIFGLAVLSGCGGTPRADDIAPIAVATISVPASSEPIVTTPTPIEPTEVPPQATTEVQPDEGPTLTFNISGGVVGFCDELMIDQEGTYRLHSCEQEEISGTLSQADLEAIQNWQENLADFEQVFEDNPGNPDNLSSTLIFKGQGTESADETQQQIISDWVNGLLVRLRPQPAPPPVLESVEVGPDGLCPDIQRPAMIVANYENPGGLILVDPGSGANCEITLHQPPFGRIATTKGNLYYPVFSLEAETITLWQLSATGEQTPLEFTTVEAAGPFSFTFSDDGTKIAWTQTVVDFEVEPPVYTNSLWVADRDGSNQVTLIDQVENTETRYVEAVRFASDNSTLYYALQPDGLGGHLFSFSGRYDTMYGLSTAGGQSQLIYACPAGEAIICIGDVSPDGTVLAVVQPDQAIVELIGSDGNLVATLTPPATDYVGSPVFGPTGNLAFVSATLAQPSAEDLPRPNPGYISLVRPPYQDSPQTLLTDNNVAALWEWLDQDRLAYGSMNEDGSVGVSVLTMAGQFTELSPNLPLAVLR